MTRWFRLYSAAMRNPKVMRLSDGDFRMWVRLLAIAAENDGIIPPLCDLKLVLRMRLDHLSSALNRLIKGGLISPLEDHYEPHDWAKHQYKSDTSTQRVKKHRTERNVSVTPPETETETDNDLANAKPLARKRGARLPDGWRPSTLSRETVAGEIAEARGQQWMRRTFEQFDNHWRNATGRGAAKLDWQAAWANWVIDQDRRDGSRKTTGGQEKRNNLYDAFNAIKDGATAFEPNPDEPRRLLGNSSVD